MFFSVAIAIAMCYLPFATYLTATTTVLILLLFTFSYVHDDVADDDDAATAPSWFLISFFSLFSVLTI